MAWSCLQKVTHITSEVSRYAWLCEGAHLGVDPS